ncbi:hypothetical protein LACPH_001053 [Lacticaseibacillus parahuelsenbergensis]|uniref:Uncharacterized protein n=1 Tax=Lacticaseibacillus parahuelsenbergensis TaxID=3068305 RepID=A0ABY9L5V3_9LACO|nr:MULTISPECIES: hypothetical protein [Lacticaseibacillus]MDE3282130.1 hypothetical protein [Lacticaseibacillus casei]WLV79022.1 hypothetical protein LACPH_001053 [Lacticaseibacillus sp. NCIMB 15471]
MNIGEMSFPDILKKYRDRNVQVTFKDGHIQDFYVEEIENQLDGWDDVLFMMDSLKGDGPGEVWLHEIKDIKALN